MEFLKDLFTEPLSYEAFEKAVKAKGLKLADLSGGEYVSKDKFDKVNSDLKEAKNSLTTVTTELDILKEGNASAEEWRQKYEKLQNEVSEKERKAQEEAVAAEKQANLQTRYSAVCVTKDGKPLEWTHDAIKDSYFAKFVEAVDDKANIGKSDADIFNNLVKDDATAFKGVQIVNMAGGKPINTHGVSKEDFMKMGYAERLQIKTEQPDLYNTLINNKE